jgi:hypothetical protein
MRPLTVASREDERWTARRSRSHVPHIRPVSFDGQNERRREEQARMFYSTGPDEYADVPETHLDQAVVQAEQDAIFGWGPPKVPKLDVPDERTDE